MVDFAGSEWYNYSKKGSDRMKTVDKVPQGALERLEKHGIFAHDVLLCALSDRDRDGVRLDNCIFLTSDTLAFIGGSAVTTGTGFPVSGKHICEFREVSSSFYSLDDFDSLSLEELVSTVRLVGEKDGKYTLLTYGSFTAKETLLFICKCFSAMKNGEELPDDEREEKYCPRCGRRYIDIQRKICSHCMKKSLLIKKMLFYLKRYKISVFFVLLMLSVSSALAVFTPYLSSGFFYDKVLTEGGEFYGRLLLVIGMIIATKLLTVAVNIIHGVVSARISAKLVCDMRKLIFSSFERLSVGFFSARQTGGLMSQVENDADALYWFFCDGLPYYIVSIVQIVAIFVIMITVNPILAVASLITVPLGIFVFLRLFRKSRVLHMHTWTKTRKMNGILSDSISGVRVVKAFAKERREVERFDAASREKTKADRDATYFNITRFPIANFIMNMSVYVVWGLGGWMVVTKSGGMSYGILVTFIAYIGMVISHISDLINMTFDLTNCLNSAQRMSEIIDASPDVRESENPVPLGECRGEVAFDGVSFSYIKNRTVIDHMSFDVPSGYHLGIVGHTGAGKSTIANLILRLYDAEEGSVKIDGIDVKDLSFDDLRKNISIVSQETYLFYGSILDNIRYAKPDATYDEVIAASKAAGAHEFIIKLDDGYDTKIGFGYKDLSGGERQRVSIARAILRDPKILILDEATSAMDTETEMRIQHALDELSRGRTTITIAHRLSTLRGSDALIVIEDGKICERGTHDELIRQKGVYYNLYTLQAQALKNVGIEE